MTPRAGTTPAILLVIAGLACQEVGASLAVLLFPHGRPARHGDAAARLLGGPAAADRAARACAGTRATAGSPSLGFGVVLAVMNGLFYLALERLPLGVTVTIEVLGPLVLSIVASRRASAWLWALLALAGVLALGGGGLGAARPARRALRPRRGGELGVLHPRVGARSGGSSPSSTASRSR